MRGDCKTARATFAQGHDCHLNGLYLCLFLLGVGAYTPWGVLLSAVDYFEDLYPERDVLRWISIACIPSTFAAVLGNTLIPAKDRGHTRITAGFSLFIILLLAIPTMDFVFIHDGGGTGMTFCLTMVIVAVLGFLDGIVEGSFTGLALYLPEQYYQGYLSGNGFASVVMIALRVVTKAAFSESASGLRISAYIFFLASCLICIACLFAHRHVVIRHPLFRTSLDPESPLIDNALPLIPPTGVGSLYLPLAEKLKTPAALLFIFNVVVYTLFPGVISDVKASQDIKSGSFCDGDVSAR